MRVFRVEDADGRGPYIDNSTPLRAYIQESLILDAESGQYPPAQEDGLPVGEQWSYAFPTVQHAHTRLVDVLNEIRQAGYNLSTYEVPDHDVVLSTSGTQVAFVRTSARQVAHSSLELAAVDAGVIDPFEGCCPHCEFCGDDHPRECTDCLTPPQFTHDDSENCVFLGHFEGHDLYVHHKGYPTYIARYGNDGPDYITGAFLVGLDPHISEAHRVATLRGIAVPGLPDPVSSSEHPQ